MNISVSQPANSRFMQACALLLFCCLPLLFAAYAIAAPPKYMKVEAMTQGDDLIYAVEETKVDASVLKPVVVTKEIDTFQATLKQIAEQLFANLDDDDPQTGLLADGLAFTVFADLKKLNRTSSFGRYLSEQLMGEFQQHGFPVIEVRKSNSIMVMDKRGEYGLSRDLEEIGKAARARALLTGTYTVAGDHIMVNAKILDNANSTMLSSATVMFEKNDLTDMLLSDSASAYPKKDAYVYMKELEFK